MKTYTINKPEELKQFKNKFGYYVDGNLIANCNLDIERYLRADGFIKADKFIKAKWDIEAGKFIKTNGFIKTNSYIKADGFIKAVKFIKANRFIKAGEDIESGGYIEAGGPIEAGGSIIAGKGILAESCITCKGTLKAGGKIFAGYCTWREITDEEKTITCEKLIGGKVEYGILNETLKGKNLTRKELKKLYNLVEKTETKPDLIVDGKFYKEITSSKEEQ